MTEEQQTKESLPGLPSEQFETVVRALSELRREGQYLIFLSKRKYVRFIGNIDAFRSYWARMLGRDTIQTDEARQALEEVRDILRYCVTAREPERATQMLGQGEYEAELKRYKPDQVAQLRSFLRNKVDFVFEHLYRGSLAKRNERLSTAVVPCLEDLDVEVISDRDDELRDEHISAPFLRLRLRYSVGEAPDHLPWFLGELAALGGTVKAFEIECDEADIDLMLRRLLSAKERLLHATDGESDDEP